MKKLSVIVLAFLTVSLIVNSHAQERVILPLTGWKYHNGNKSNHATGDTIRGAVLDTVVIGTTGIGSLAPVAVTISVQLTDADVSATADSVKIRYEIGNLGLYSAWISATTYDSVNVLSTGSPQSDNPFIRTFTFTTDGESAAEKNASTGIIPHADAISLIMRAGTTDSVSYKIRASGIYTK